MEQLKKFIQTAIKAETHATLRILGIIRGEKLSEMVEKAIENYLQSEEVKREIENHGK